MSLKSKFAVLVVAAAPLAGCVTYDAGQANAVDEFEGKPVGAAYVLDVFSRPKKMDAGPDEALGVHRLVLHDRGTQEKWTANFGYQLDGTHYLMGMRDEFTREALTSTNDQCVIGGFMQEAAKDGKIRYSRPEKANLVDKAEAFATLDKICKLEFGY